MEQLRNSWFDAKTEGEQKKIAEQMQVLAFEEVPYIPLGQSIPPTAYRRDISGVLSGHPFFWNVRRQAT
jgi:peptide/nickel transport system substrate-binding protein